MKKTGIYNLSICLLSAAFLATACGQSKQANAPVADTTAAAETTAEEPTARETAAAGSKATSEESTGQETEAKETSAAEESAGEDTSGEVSQPASAPQVESTAAQTETAAETQPSAPETQPAAPETQPPVPETQPAAPETVQKSVKDIYGEITQKITLNSPMVLPDEFISNYYGIDVGTLDEYVFSMSEAAISAETVAILKAKDPADVEGLRTSLQAVIDQKRAEMENYLPDQFQIVDKSSVQVNGNYVYLVISEQEKAITQIIQTDIQ